MSWPINFTGQYKPFEDVVLSFYRNPHVSARSTHYLYRSGHNDFVKTIVVQQFFDRFNQQHELLGGRISWLLTKPLDFMGLQAANQVQIQPTLVEDHAYHSQITKCVKAAEICKQEVSPI